MNELALFAGAGGGLLGTRLLGWRSVCYVEKDPYCIQVLKARIKDGYLDDAPIWDDVRTFDGKPWAGLVDVITAGFPCQPFSGAGLQLGERDERNMWPDTMRIIRQVRPRCAFLENVSCLVSSSYFGVILGDLAESWYDAQWDCIPASAVGAPHQRDRLWVVAHASGERYATTIQHQHRRSSKAQLGGNGKVQSMANANGGGFEECAQFDSESKDNTTDRHTFGGHVGGCGDQVPNSDRERQQEQWGTVTTAESGTRIFFDFEPGDWWNVEPELGRVANGVAHRVDRLRALGNGQVPAVVRAAWNYLTP